MKTTLSLCLLPALLAPAALCAGEVREEILVIVNNHIITRKSFQQAVEQEHAALYRQFSGKELDAKLKAAREKTLQGLIDAFILEDKAADLDIKVGMDYVRERVEEIKKQYQFATDADFEKALQGSQGITLDEFMRRQQQMIQQQEVLRREVFSRIAIEEQELLAYYQDHASEFRKSSRFRIRELVLPKGGTPEEQAASKAKLEQIQTALKAGTAFETLAKEHSSSPSKATGGDLGWMTRGLMRKSIEDAALALKPDQVSAPLETDKDYILLQLIASEDEAARPFAEVRAQILEKLQEPKAQNAIENFLTAQRSRANIRYLVPREQILKG